jgi:hypothetical protein
MTKYKGIACGTPEACPDTNLIEYVEERLFGAALLILNHVAL